MSGQDEYLDRIDTDNSRLLALSDGIFAFAMTLLVLQIDVPDSAVVTADKLPAYVRDQGPHALSYAISFVVIATYWRVHHRLFRLIRGHDQGLISLNILCLFLVSFLPFPTDLVGEYSASRFAVIFYSVSMIVTSLTFSGLWYYASHDRRLIHEHVSAHKVRYQLLHGLSVPIVFLISIGVALIQPDVARYSWLLLGPSRWLTDRLLGGDG